VTSYLAIADFFSFSFSLLCPSHVESARREQSGGRGRVREVEEWLIHISVPVQIEVGRGGKESGWVRSSQAKSNQAKLSK